MLEKIKVLLQNDVLKYLLTKGGVSFLFRIVGMVLGFLNIWLISNYFNAEVYGIFSIVQTILLITTMVFTLGVQNVLVIKINSEEYFEDRKKPLFFLIKTIKIILVVSLIPISVFYFGKEVLGDLFGNTELSKHFEIIAFAIPFLLLHEIFLYYFISKKKFVIYGFFMFFLPNILFTFSVILFNKYITESFHITLILCLSFIFCFILEGLLIFKRFNFKNKQKQAISSKDVLRKSIPMMFSGIMVLLLNWTDVLMLGIMMSEEDVGIYNAAFKIGFVVLIIISTINIVVVPKISEMFQKGEKEAFRKFINRTTQLVSLATLPIVILLIVFGKFILSQFGADFEKGYSVLVIIVISSFFNTFCGNVDQILNFTNNQVFLMKLNIILLLLNVILNVIFIQQFGIEGAAFSSLISTVLFNGICVIFIKRKLGFYTFI